MTRFYASGWWPGGKYWWDNVRKAGNSYAPASEFIEFKKWVESQGGQPVDNVYGGAGPGRQYIEFNNEEDATAFKLKYM